MYRDSDQLYRRAIGMSYDDDLLARQVSNGDRGGYDSDEDDTYSFDGSDLIIIPVTMQLSEVGRDLDRLRQKSEMGTLTTQDIDEHEFMRIQQISESLHRQYEALAEEDERYAGAIQDWMINELQVRHPDFAAEQKNSNPNQMLAQLVESAAIVSDLLTELREDGEDHRLIRLAEAWYQELLADGMMAEFKHYYELAA